MSIKQAFNKDAKDYDSARKQLIPCFDDFYGTALDLIPFDRADHIKVLDLGAGTGLFSCLVSERYAKAEFTLIDISDKMLEEAKKRFADAQLTVAYVVSDYSNATIEGSYDLIVSALSIHHLSDSEKEKLFHKIFLNLRNNGVFINADQVLGETQSIEKVYRSSWLKQVKDRGVTEGVLGAALERMKEDKMSTLSAQLGWMEKAGFSDVNCWYQNYSFVVYSGCKKNSQN